MLKKFYCAIITIGLLSFGSTFASDLSINGASIDRVAYSDMPDTYGPFPKDNSKD